MTLSWSLLGILSIICLCLTLKLELFFNLLRHVFLYPNLYAARDANPYPDITRGRPILIPHSSWPFQIVLLSSSLNEFSTIPLILSDRLSATGLRHAPLLVGEYNSDDE